MEECSNTLEMCMNALLGSWPPYFNGLLTIFYQKKPLIWRVLCYFKRYSGQEEEIQRI